MVTKELGLFFKGRVSEIRVKQIRVNQGLGVEVRQIQFINFSSVIIQMFGFC